MSHSDLVTTLRTPPKDRDQVMTHRNPFRGTTRSRRGRLTTSPLLPIFCTDQRFSERSICQDRNFRDREKKEEDGKTGRVFNL